MRYYIDCEFYERPHATVEGHVIEPISYGVVAEDGREFYAEVADFDWDRSYGPADTLDWLKDNVRPHLTGETFTRKQIAWELQYFVGADPQPEFWGYFADYDWVCIAQLFGKMIDLPSNFPKYCLDIKQEMHRLQLPRSKFIPVPTGAEHNALADARWHAELHRQLRKLEEQR